MEETGRLSRESQVRYDLAFSDPEVQKNAKTD